MKKEPENEDMIKKDDWMGAPKQAVIDPTTGRDVTGEYVSYHKKEMEKQLKQLFIDAREKKEKRISPQKIYDNLSKEIEEIIKDYYAALKLPPEKEYIQEKQKELAKILEINYPSE